MKILLVLFFIIYSSTFLSANLFKINKEKTAYIKKTFGKTAVKRVNYVDNYFKKNKHLYKKNSLKTVKNVNKFYNKLVYLKDIHHWKKKDYWSSLIEFVSTGAGDSEDFAMAKLYTLIHLGFDKTKFALVNTKKAYIRSKKVGDEHIVLLYKHTKYSQAIILDSINKKLKIFKKKKNYKSLDKPRIFIQNKLNTMVDIK